MEALIPTILFYLFGGLVLISAVAVIASRNPVHSVLFLIFAFFNAAALFILIGAEYIAMTLVIVYVGAVAVLFLFVVMMLDVDFVELRAGFLRYLPWGLLVAAFIFVELVFALNAGIEMNEPAAALRHPVIQAEGVTNTEAIGSVLYSYYAYPFQLAGLVLLVAMIGAIVLTLRSRGDVRKQIIAEQLARKREDGMTLVDVKPGQGI